MSFELSKQKPTYFCCSRDFYHVVVMLQWFSAFLTREMFAAGQMRMKALCMLTV